MPLSAVMVKSGSVNSISNLSRASKRLHDRRSDLSNTFVKKFRTGTRLQRAAHYAKEQSDLSRASQNEKILLTQKYKEFQKNQNDTDSLTNVDIEVKNDV